MNTAETVVDEYMRRRVAGRFTVSTDTVLRDVKTCVRQVEYMADALEVQMAADVYGRDMPRRCVARWPADAWQAVRVWAATLAVVGWCFSKAEVRWPIRWCEVWSVSREWLPDLAGHGRVVRVAKLSHEPSDWADATHIHDWGE